MCFKEEGVVVFVVSYVHELLSRALASLLFQRFGLLFINCMFCIYSFSANELLLVCEAYSEGVVWCEGERGRESCPLVVNVPFLFTAL